MKNKRKALKPEQYKAIALMVYKDVNGLTNEMIAKEVGVNPSTLYEWKKGQAFNDELIRQSEEVQRSFLADTYTQLRMIINNPKAKEGTKIKAIELVLKNQGRLKDVQEVTQSVDEKSLTDILTELNNI
ncbi:MULTISPECIES: phBC6A51 family helix-turn-helix protein [Bacillus]|uniref:phBC6A51 family helix-turn-helix protein n=1 Tax=Bacillus TaxID=1386 RepID=UPI00084BA9AF|nr:MULTISPECIES: phBC6A51 family helix-turn-helix protein [Bacillus subtilis group]MCY8796245.1 phBC6A51 family helix-turn-helix protein [Bacillus inaquosorum]MDF3254977.1 phBC6A51 family helix-turn-helix protein [Bacillus velezensis]MDF3267794.1 phBC6A51 family helix-turn-helix protein [Bacillus velezensis]MEC0772047.1 phBC6A51 family helix-turn-helix protein [Bacillus inaquosorum]MEC0797416.1 phBC6A51 family helix-turn-helix protein [Bacillus inaquosorum]